MLRYLDQSGTFVRMISEIEYSDLQITRTLSDGDKTLSFVYRGKYTDLSLEGYIETEDDSYVIKEIMPRAGASEYRCRLNIEPLEAGTIKQFTAQNKTISQAANAALVGTGWTCSVDSGISSKVRSVQQFNKTPFELLLKIRDAFMCEVKFDSIGKVVTFKEEFGSDKGVYLRPELNLIDVSLTLDSYDFYTRIIPRGADGLDIKSVNSGVEYVENYQYSTKVRTLYWEDTNYTDAQALKDDATAKLADLSKPKRSYSASVRDLAKLSSQYSILDYDIGDTVTITDEPSGIRDKQRIVSITEYPAEPERNTVELSNTVLTWEEYQSRLEAAASAWEDVSNSDGSINGIYVHGVQADDVVKVQVDVGGTVTETNLNSAISTVQSDISAIDLRVGTVETTYLQATMANIDTANINTAKVKDLFVQVGLIRDAVIDGARITGYLDAVTVNAASITAGTLVADRIAIRGDTNALVYALNNYGQITSQEVDTLDGYILTDRTVNADKIVAHSITTTEITTQNLVGTNGWINLSLGTFAYGVDALTWDGTTLGVKGVVEATSGKLGAWTLTDHNFYASANNTATGGVERWTGMQVPGNGNIAITVGATAYGNWSTAPFYVTHAGVMHATGATISGTLTAGANSVIGPWTVSASSIYYGNSAYGNASGLYFGTSGLSITDKFKVSSAGAMAATSGKIGGWTIGSANLSITPSTTRYVTLSDGTNANGDVIVVRTGAGTTADPYLYPFHVHADGRLVASNATITGNITATSMTAKNTYYIHNSSGTKKVAMTAPDSSFGSSLSIGSGFSAVHLGGTNGVVTDGDIYVGGTGTDISLGANGYISCTRLYNGYITLNGSTVTVASATSGESCVIHNSYATFKGGTANQSLLFGNGTGTSVNVGIYNNTSARWIICYSTSTKKTSIPDYTSSDIRIKTDIAKSKVNALDAVRQMEVCEFKKDGRYQPIGIIADWVEEIDPLLVEGGGYENGHMNIKSIDMFYLQGYLIKAIQELSDQLDQLRRTASWKS